MLVLHIAHRPRASEKIVWAGGWNRTNMNGRDPLRVPVSLRQPFAVFSGCQPFAFYYLFRVGLLQARSGAYLWRGRDLNPRLKVMSLSKCQLFHPAVLPVLKIKNSPAV